MRIRRVYIKKAGGETLDGTVDLRPLGPGWVLFGADADEEAEEAFLKGYELAGR